MKASVFLIVVVAGALLAAGCSLHSGNTAATTQPSAVTRQPPAVVVAKLPEIGTVYERTYCTGTGPLRFALGIRYLKIGQSGVARFRAGGFSRNREMQPGYPTTWFPRRRSRTQWLAAAAGGENGSVVGWVRVVGRSAHSDRCQSGYDPLRVTVKIYPRSLNYNENSWGYLRHLIG
ncbi:MAG: hypothetical protein QOG85_2426 [Gaiellaceae bacterium]|jgi:hypothetical protein|nr:hypothetical protein [Gaiellaceae bacterium]